jgi:hypothetical protein
LFLLQKFSKKFGKSTGLASNRTEQSSKKCDWAKTLVYSAKVKILQSSKQRPFYSKDGM